MRELRRRHGKERPWLEPATKLLDVPCRDRQQSYLTRPLDRLRYLTLVLRASAGLATRLDLSTFGNVTTQTNDVLIVDLFNLVDTELTYLTSRGVPTTTTSAWRSAPGPS